MMAFHVPKQITAHSGTNQISIACLGKRATTRNSGGALRGYAEISASCPRQKKPRGASGKPGASAVTLTHLLDRAKEEHQHALAYVDQGVGQVFWPSFCPDLLSGQYFRGGCGRNIAASASGPRVTWLPQIERQVARSGRELRKGGGPLQNSEAADPSEPTANGFAFVPDRAASLLDLVARAGRAGGSTKNVDTITPSQCKAARALLELTQGELADAPTLGLSTIVDFAKQRRQVSVVAIRAIGQPTDGEWQNKAHYHP
jgi:hypothetical protein